jgi:hypothetical protein
MRLFIVLVLTVTALAQSHSVKTEKPIVNDGEETNKSHKSASEVQGKPTPPVAVNPTADQPDPQVEANGRADHPDNRVYSVNVVSQPRDPLYLKYVIINAFIAAIGVGTLFAVWRQGDVMKRQLAAFIESQRPQLTLSPHENPGKDFFDPRGPHLYVAVKNVGLMTAYDCTHETWIEVITPPFTDFSDAADHFVSSDRVSLRPNSDPMVINIPLRRGFKPGEEHLIKTHAQDVCIRVLVKYRDIFNPHRYANFGYMLDATGFRFLPKYHDSN